MYEVRDLRHNVIDDRGFLLSSFVMQEVSLETSSARKRNQIEISAVSGDGRDSGLDLVARYQ